MEFPSEYLVLTQYSACQLLFYLSNQTKCSFAPNSFEYGLTSNRKEEIAQRVKTNGMILIQGLSQPAYRVQSIRILHDLCAPNDNIPELKGYGYFLIGNHLPELETLVISARDYHQKREITDLMLRLIEIDNEEQRQKLVTSFNRILGLELVEPPQTEELLEGDDPYFQYVEIFSSIFKYGTREQVIESTNMIASALDSASTLEQKSRIGRIAVKMMGGAERIDERSLAVQAARELSRYILQDYGLDFSELIGPWMNYKFESSNLGVVTQNLEAIIILESLKPKLNIARTLYQEFGIKLFHRYPSEVLIEQFDKRNDQGASYAVLASCIADYNQALASIGFLRFVKSLHQNLKRVGYTLRIFEDGSEEEIKRDGQRINDRYGVKSSPLILIAGHGEPHSVRMNWDHPRYPSRVIRQQAFNDGIGIRFTDFIADGGTVALISCSTGAVGGIAQEISKQGLTALGPDEVAALGLFHINRKDNTLEFNASFPGAKTNKYRNGVLLAA